jgi:hypothetical protein
LTPITLIDINKMTVWIGESAPVESSIFANLTSNRVAIAQRSAFRFPIHGTSRAKQILRDGPKRCIPAPLAGLRRDRDRDRIFHSSTVPYSYASVTFQKDSSTITLAVWFSDCVQGRAHVFSYCHFLDSAHRRADLCLGPL